MKQNKKPPQVQTGEAETRDANTSVEYGTNPNPNVDILLKIYDVLLRIETQLKTEVVTRDKFR